MLPVLSAMGLQHMCVQWHCGPYLGFGMVFSHGFTGEIAVPVSVIAASLQCARDSSGFLACVYTWLSIASPRFVHTARCISLLHRAWTVDRGLGL